MAKIERIKEMNLKKYKIIYMELDNIISYENNPRINDEAVDMVASSIKEFGFKNPIVVDKNNVIINGHTRLKAAYKLGLTEAPVIIADDLTEDQVKAFRLVDNRTSEIAQWDFSKLEEELNNIDLNMSDFNFEALIGSGGGESYELDTDYNDEVPNVDLEKNKGKQCTCPVCGLKFTPIMED